MFGMFKLILPLADDHDPDHRRRRFVPSIAVDASGLEDRVLLSGVGHSAHTAEVAKPLAETAAGQRVTALFGIDPPHRADQPAIDARSAQLAERRHRQGACARI